MFKPAVMTVYATDDGNHRARLLEEGAKLREELSALLCGDSGSLSDDDLIRINHVLTVLKTGVELHRTNPEVILGLSSAASKILPLKVYRPEQRFRAVRDTAFNAP